MYISIKRNKRGGLFTLMYRMLLLSHVGITVALVTENTQLEQICSYAILFIAFLLYVYSFIDKPVIRTPDMLFLLTLAYLMILSLAKEWQFDNYVTCLVYVSMLTVWRSSAVVSTKEMLSSVGVFFTIQGLILIGLFFSPLAYKAYQDYARVSQELTLGFSNPNQTGIVLFSTIAVLYLLSDYQTSKQKCLAMRVESLLLCILLVLTNARTSIVGLICLAYTLFIKEKRKKNVLLANGIICFPIIFVFPYIWLAQTKFGDLELWGKKLFSGRQRVYSEVLRQYTDKLFGNIEVFNFANSHNALLTILVNIGILGLVLYLLYTITSFNSFYRKCSSKKQESCAIVILILFVMSCAETAVLTGGTIYYVHMLTILQIANNTSLTTKRNEDGVYDKTH